jgi:hypothetical protein
MKSIEATLEIQNTPTDKTNELLTTVLTASTSFLLWTNLKLYVISNYIESIDETSKGEDDIEHVVDYIISKLFNTENTEGCLT